MSIPDFQRICARPDLLKLNRPVVARIATIAEWPSHRRPGNTGL
jgi:hypothetical protein